MTSRGGRRLREFIWLSVFVGGFLGRLAAASLEDPPRVTVVRYADGNLTVELHRARLQDVLTEIGRQTGMTISGEVDEDQEVDTTFESEAVVSALRRLLGARNYLVQYDRQGHLRKLTLVSNGATPSAGALNTAQGSPASCRPAMASASALNASPRLRRLARRLIRRNDPRELEAVMNALVGRSAAGVTANSDPSADDPLPELGDETVAH